VKIVDEFTGRTLDGRRWSDGLHQAVEAKERVRIQEENHTWATVQLQHYFRMYESSRAMTVTAETEAASSGNTYKLSRRADSFEPAARTPRPAPTSSYKTETRSSPRSSRTCASAVISPDRFCSVRRPVEKSELLSRELSKPESLTKS